MPIPEWPAKHYAYYKLLELLCGNVVRFIKWNFKNISTIENPEGFFSVKWEYIILSV
jgi:hypothetical protein